MRAMMTGVANKFKGGVADVPFTPNTISGLQGWIEGDAGLSTDLSDNAYTVINNSVQIGTQLNGHDTFLYSGTDYQSFGTQLGKPSSFTVSAIIYVDNVNNRGVPFGSGTGSDNNSWGAVTVSQNSRPTGSILSLASDGSTALTTYTGSVLSSGTWYRVTTRYSAGDSTINLFVDGVMQSVTNTGSTTGNSGTAIEYSIGKLGSHGTLGFDGRIAEVRIYNEAVSDSNLTLLGAYDTDKYNL